MVLHDAVRQVITHFKWSPDATDLFLEEIVYLAELYDKYDQDEAVSETNVWPSWFVYEWIQDWSFKTKTKGTLFPEYDC